MAPEDHGPTGGTRRGSDHARRRAAAVLVALVLGAAGGCGGAGRVVDLTELAATAQWRSGQGELVFGAESAPLAAMAGVRPDALLEDGSRATVLVTRPDDLRFARRPDGRTGFVSATFTLPGPIRSGDRLTARVGLLEGTRSRGVEFRVLDGRPGAPLGQVVDGPDGELKELVVDLSAVAGSREITIEVDGGPGGATGDAAVWVDLRIEGG